MPVYGYAGKVLMVDLSTETIRTEPLDMGIAEKFIGGRGLGDAILYKQLKPGVDPLSPENILVLTTGALTGTGSPFSSRSWIVTKSPLTGTILMSNAGGFFGPELKYAGYDAVIIHGKSEKPVYLWVRDGEVELRDASHLTGLGTSETQKRILEETDSKARVCCIGPAGERLVRYASVISGDRAFGRGGAGAVMGSKNLKAIAVRGTGRVDLYDGDRFMEVVKDVLDTFKANAFIQEWRKYGTPYIVGPMNELGIFPTRNFQTGVLEGYDRVAKEVEMEYTVKHETCHLCPVACTPVCEVKSGEYAGYRCRGPEYEHVYAYGGACGNTNYESIIAAVSLSDELGLDVISTGACIGFAMELHERGLLPKELVGELDLRFGNHRAVVQLVRMIGMREGLGDLLAEGVVRAAEKIGGEALRYAMHVKGMELPGYDPRGAKAMGLGYATSPRGGCHHTGYAPQELFDPSFDRITPKGKAELTKRNQDTTVMVDSTGLCAFPYQLAVIKMEQVASLLYYATGIEEFSSVDRLMLIGERIFNLERLFNVREGFTAKDDTLPERLLKEPMPEGASKGQVVELDEMLSEYYRIRGWDENGVPTEEKLRELGLPP